tara:strand:- start:3325 stop:3636 length:312 start_codon:yes stop_codon:yes gene_type:complete
MENVVYDFDLDVFSIKVKAKKKRITISQILKKIDCEHIALEKVLTNGGNYFLFTYDTHPDFDGEDRPEWADWAQHSVNVHQLNHMSLDKWVEEGRSFARDMSL